jgi:hypothetical protein
MKSDLIVQKAKKVVNELGLSYRIDHLKQYTNAIDKYKHSENELRKYIFDMADDDHQRNYLFVNRVLKQIDLMLL